LLVWLRLWKRGDVSATEIELPQEKIMSNENVALKYLMCSKEGDVDQPMALKYIMCSKEGKELSIDDAKSLLDKTKPSPALKYLMCSKEM
jgi:hypothetical protein